MVSALLCIIALLENQGGVGYGAEIGVRGDDDKEGQGGILSMRMLLLGDTMIFLGTAWTKRSKRSSGIVDPLAYHQTQSGEGRYVEKRLGVIPLPFSGQKRRSLQSAPASMTGNLGKGR